MPDLTNAQVAAAFDELGDLYELDGAVSYRVIAYRNAAKAVRESSVSIIAMTREGRVTSVPGIGKTLEEKLRALDDELGIDSIDALRAALEAGTIRDLRGFGLKAEAQLKETLAAYQAAGGPAPRVVLSRAEAIAEEVVAALRAHPASDRVEVAGSLRRRADSVKVVAPDQFGNVLQHFTGSKAHNVALRESAVRRGLHISEYGILDDASGDTLRCAREEEVYERLGLLWIPPELREGRGELEAAGPGGDGLPDLIVLD